MSCENCNIIIRNVIGTPSAYKIRWTKLNDSGETVYVNNGPITADEIRETNLSIFAGGPGHETLGQFWEGNNISVRFENYYNEECYLDVLYSCEPATTTTTPSTDCCDGMLYAIKTTGTMDDQTPLAGFSTRGFAAGTFQQTLDPDTFGYTVDQPGTGKICYGEVNKDPLAVRVNDLAWSIFLRNEFGQFVEADGTTLMQVPNSIGRIFMNRPWASNTSPNNEAVYVSPNGTCFRGELNENNTGLTIWEQVT